MDYMGNSNLGPTSGSDPEALAGGSFRRSRGTLPVSHDGTAAYQSCVYIRCVM